MKIEKENKEAAKIGIMHAENFRAMPDTECLVILKQDFIWHEASPSRGGWYGWLMKDSGSDTQWQLYPYEINPKYPTYPVFRRVVEALLETNKKESIRYLLEPTAKSFWDGSGDYFPWTVASFQEDLRKVLGNRGAEYYLRIFQLKKKASDEAFKKMDEEEWSQDPLGPYIRDLMEMNALVSMKRENFRGKHDRAISDLETHIRKKYPDIDL